MISNALALAPLVPLSNDIAIYRTGEDGTVFEEDLEDNRQLESKIGEEGSSYDDKDDAFLDSLNHMRRTYGIENAYNNFGAFLSNVSDFIRDCSVVLSNEPLSSLLMMLCGGIRCHRHFKSPTILYQRINLV